MAAGSPATPLLARTDARVAGMYCIHRPCPLRRQLAHVPPTTCPSANQPQPSLWSKRPEMPHHPHWRRWRRS